MRSRIQLLPYLLVIFFLYCSFNTRYAIETNVNSIVLDAGHGGKDPGTSGSVSKEKTIALAVVLELEKILKQYSPNIEVNLTRRNDTFVELIERAAIANRKKTDLFISVHCNASPSKDISGSETYAVGLHKEDQNLDVIMNENSSILLEENYLEKYDGFDPKSEEGYIIFSLLQNAYLKQSLYLARKIEDYFQQKTGRKSRGVKQAGFLVLWKTTMPSVLIETGYLSNKIDEKFLNSVEGRQHIANSIYKAIREYRTDLKS